MKNPSRVTSLALLVLANILWSGNYLAGHILSGSAPPFILNATRWIISAIILLVAVKLRKQNVPFLREWRAFSLLGFFGMIVFSGFTYWGLHMVPAGMAGLLAGAIPIAVLLSSVVIAHDTIWPAQWAAVALSFIGEILLVNSPSGSKSYIGIVILLAANIAWGIYTALGRRYRNRFNALTLTTGAAVWGAGYSIVIAAIQLLSQPVQVHVGWATIIATLYISTMASVVAFVAWSRGVNSVGAGVAAPYLNLLPVFTLILAVVLLHEPVITGQIEGGVLVIAGAIWASLIKGPKTSGISASESPSIKG